MHLVFDNSYRLPQVLTEQVSPEAPDARTTTVIATAAAAATADMLTSAGSLLVL